MKERLQKILSAAGVCSRRKAEELIAQGRVTVNGETARVGDSADPDRDRVCVDGRAVAAEKKLYLMLNKPRGYVTTLSDEAGRKSVQDLLTGVPRRVYPVGRLDMHSEGLLLLTNDGEMAHKLMHPSHEVYKQYLVKLTPDREGLPSPEMGYVMTIAIRQGKNRQIRRMCAACGYTVNALKRVAEGAVKLRDLPSGTWRYLTRDEVEYLRSL